MPEATFRSARVRLELLSQERSGLSVFLLASGFVKEEEVAAGKDVIDVVLVD